MTADGWQPKMRRRILAFAHITKAGGTTLSHILHRNFPLRHAQVLPLTAESPWVLQPRDLREILRIHPALECMYGHFVQPHVDFSEVADVRFITVLREPVSRYISNFQFVNEVMGWSQSFDTYMAKTKYTNVQTKYIGGSESVADAKEIMKTRCIAVGTMDEYDEFLVLFRRAMEPRKIKLGYKKLYVSKKDSEFKRHVLDNFDKYRDDIMNANRADLELYDYVKNELLPEQKKAYGPMFEQDVAEFVATKDQFSDGLLVNMSKAFNKLYTFRRMQRLRKIRGVATE